MILKSLPITLPKCEMGLVLRVPIVGDSLTGCDRCTYMTWHLSLPFYLSFEKRKEKRRDRVARSSCTMDGNDA